MKVFFLYLLLSASCLGLWQCRSLKFKEQITDSTTVVETIRPIKVKIEGQDVIYQYVIKCLDGKPYIASGSGQKQMEDGSRASWMDRNDKAFNSVMLDTNGVLFGMTGCDSLEATVYAKDREINRLKSLVKIQEMRPERKWYNTALGQFAILALVVAAAAYVLSNFIKR